MRSFRLIVDRKPNQVILLGVDQTFHILLLAIATMILAG